MAFQEEVGSGSLAGGVSGALRHLPVRPYLRVIGGQAHTASKKTAINTTMTRNVCPAGGTTVARCCRD